MKKFIPILLLCLVFLLPCSREKKPKTFSVGSFEISFLNESEGQSDASLLIDATPEIIEKYTENSRFVTGINAFVLKANGKTILVDSGLGVNLIKNLKILKIDPKQVNVILLTHMHGDHIGGLLNNNKVVFPNAELYVSKQEHDYWMRNLDSIPQKGRRNFIMAQNVIKSYAARLHLFNPSELGSTKENLFEGIRGIEAFGHTPGHTVYMLESDGEKMLIWGDLVHALSVQMPLPQVAISYDIDPKQAVLTRQKILEYVSKNNIPIAGMHIATPAMGFVAKSSKDDESYEFESY